MLETGAVSAEIELTDRRARRHVKQAWDTESRPQDVPTAIRSRHGGWRGSPDRAGRGIPGAEHLMVYVAVRRSEHPPIDAAGHPGVDAGIYRWIPASCCRYRALQSNHSSAHQVELGG